MKKRLKNALTATVKLYRSLPGDDVLALQIVAVAVIVIVVLASKL